MYLCSVLTEIHHLAIIAEMFVLSIAALAVYWKYIRENVPLDFHYPINRSINSSSGDQFDSLDGQASEDGNSSPIASMQQPGSVQTHCFRRLYSYNSDLTDAVVDNQCFGSPIMHL